MRIFPFLLLTLLLISSCKEASSNAKESPTTQQPKPTRGPYELPAMDKATFDSLRNTVTQIDYIFHTLPFSINQTDPKAVRSNFGLISPEQADDVSGCQPFARESFQVNGEIIMEADIYFSEDCQAYVFYRGKEKVFANKISPSGVDFYTNMINQVKVQVPKN